MVNEKKVRIMTQIALDEMTYHKKEISEGGYYKSDYVRSHVISALCSVTFSYLLCLFLVVLYYADYIFENIARLAYGKIGAVIFGGYGAIFVIVLFISYHYYTRRYAVNKVIVRGYCEKLKALEEFYQESKEETEYDTTTGA